jgi:hypothetical protein
MRWDPISGLPEPSCPWVLRMRYRMIEVTRLRPRSLRHHSSFGPFQRVSCIDMITGPEVRPRGKAGGPNAAKRRVLFRPHLGARRMKHLIDGSWWSLTRSLPRRSPLSCQNGEGWQFQYPVATSISVAHDLERSHTKVARNSTYSTADTSLRFQIALMRDCLRFNARVFRIKLVSANKAQL